MFSVVNLEIGLEISITNDCLNLLLSNRRGEGEAERGGLLFSRPHMSENIIVSKISEPKDKDKAGKYFFVPNVNLAQREINAQFRKNFAYIGDWHTHPSKYPKPSGKDITTIKAIFNKSTHDLNFILMIIVGTSDDFCDNYMALSDGCSIYELKCK